jgi:hypothetical protein
MMPAHRLTRAASKRIGPRARVILGTDIMAKPTRHDRLLDLAALVCILAGVAFCLDGTARLTGISRLSYRSPGPAGVKQVDVADHARYEAYLGVALALIGCIGGTVHAVRVNRRLPVAELS